MINASDVLENENYDKSFIKKNFVKQTKSKIKLVRVATHFHELQHFTDYKRSEKSRIGNRY